jgi:DNA-directed RNA polymerase subunit beta'
MTKEIYTTPEKKFWSDLTFYSAEEVNIALNEGRLELNMLKVKQKDFNDAGLVYKIIQTTAGRVLFNEVVPEAEIYQ